MNPLSLHSRLEVVLDNLPGQVPGQNLRGPSELILDLPNPPEPVLVPMLQGAELDLSHQEPFYLRKLPE